MAAGVLLLGALSSAAALADWLRISLAGLAVLATLGVVLLLDNRTRIARVDKRIRALARRVRTARTAETKLREEITKVEKELAAQQHQNQRLDDLSRASYRQSLRQHVRTFRSEDRLKAHQKSPALQLPHKLRNIEFAASHGISVPEIYEVWPNVAAIHLEALPEEFVLKADGGAGSVAVYPLRRIGDGRYQAIGSSGQYTEDEIKEQIRALGRHARSPFFAEELLHTPDGGPIPSDVKCYMFYGRVGQILVRTVGEHGNASTIRVKFVDEHGSDYGSVAVGRPHDPTIAVPEALPEMTAVAKHLSRAIGLPFCRVDLYDSSRGIVLGEITRAPSGGNERFVEAHDEWLGSQWIDASARLQADLSAGRPAGALFGEVADLRLYPPSDRPRSPANFGRTVVDCSLWCG